MTRPLLLLLILISFALRVWQLDRLGLAYDEAATALMARATPAEIIYFHWDAAFEHPPVWVLLMWLWSRLAGQSEVALRWLPALAGTLIVPMVWRLVQTIQPQKPRLPLISALFVACAPVMVYYSQEARMYTLVVLLALLSIYLALRLVTVPAWRRIGLFWLVNWAMTGLHYYSALVLALQFATLLLYALATGQVTTLPWRRLWLAAIGAGLPLLAWMIFAPSFAETLGVVLDTAGENQTSWQFFLSDLWRELSFGNIRWLPPSAAWGFALAPLVIAGAIVWLWPRRNESMARGYGRWLVASLALLPILSGALALRTLTPRYILFAVPLLYILAAATVVMPLPQRWRFGRIDRTLGIVLLAIPLLINASALTHYFGPYVKSDYRAMVRYLADSGAPASEALILEAPRQHLLAKYYLPADWPIYPVPEIVLPDFWPVTAPLVVPEQEDGRVQAWLQQHDALWVSYTSESEVDQGEFLAKYLTAVAYRHECKQWLDVRLCRYISPFAVTPDLESEVAANFAGELGLEGSRLSLYPQVDSTQPNTLLIELAWLALRQPTVDSKVSLRLIAANGETVVQNDEFPIGTLLLPTTWTMHDRKPGYMALALSPTLPPGEYTVQVSLYDPATMAPLAHRPLDERDQVDTVPTTDPLVLAILAVDDTMRLLPAP